MLRMKKEFRPEFLATASVCGLPTRGRVFAVRDENADIGSNGGSAFDKNVGLCRFCLQVKFLRESHIIPRAHIKAVKAATPKGEKRHFEHYSSQGEYFELKQDLWARLFCAKCEAKFGKIEAPYFKWWNKLGIDSLNESGDWPDGRFVNEDGSLGMLARGADIPLLKKMHLINLFRIGCWQPHSPIARHAVFGVAPLRERIGFFLSPRGNSEIAVVPAADIFIKADIAFMKDNAGVHPLMAALLPPISADGGFAYLINSVLWTLRPDGADFREKADLRIGCVNALDMDYPWETMLATAPKDPATRRG